MIKAFIIDDEQDAITALDIMLKKFCEGIEVCGTARSVKKAEALIQQNLPDVLFLDVEMKGETGFDLLARINHERLVIIFTTAHDQYAIQALKKGAKDYLLKPIDPDELVEAVEKAKTALSKLKLAELANEKGKPIYINTDTESLSLKKEELFYIRADGRYSELFCDGGRKLVVCKNIGEYEVELESAGFFRAHKSVLINLDHVVRIKKGEVDKVEMKDGARLPLSRRKKTELAELLSR